MLGILIRLGRLFANMAVDSASAWFLYQEKEPVKPVGTER